MTEMDNADVRNVLDTDFRKSEVQRGELKFYEPLVQRGSCRVKEGLFRTEEEQREFISEGKSIQLAKLGTNLRLIQIIHTLLSKFSSLFSHNATDSSRSKTLK
jgi:hypothetical protein